jgi:NAD(P)-dependent dehydrogenase (short-subunit alcohol dehydrogenase family)
MRRAEKPNFDTSPHETSVLASDACISNAWGPHSSNPEGHDDKVAIITGGAGGIGAAAALRFTDEGAKAMLVDMNEDALREIVSDIGDDKAAYTVADVSDSDQTQAYVDATVKRFGGIDIALMNAGVVGDFAALVDYDMAVFDKVMAVNVRGVWLGLRSAIPEMKKRGGGSIVITSSTAGIRAIRNQPAYVASKHAVIGIMRAAALENASWNIRVNTVNPSPIDTQMMTAIEEKAGLTDEQRATNPYASNTPMKRYGDPMEVANLMLFLASADSSFCTGGVYMVDGGVSAGRI